MTIEIPERLIQEAIDNELDQSYLIHLADYVIGEYQEYLKEEKTCCVCDRVKDDVCWHNTHDNSYLPYCDECWDDRDIAW